MKTLWVLAIGLTGMFATLIGRTQTTSSQSNYIFRFNSGVSSVFLANMTFPTQQPLNLGSCTANEKVNGPLSCAVNCSNQSVCLLDLSGPSGASVTDVLEKVSETPVTGASPTPAVSGVPVGFGAMTKSSRIEAYNSLTPN